MFHLRQKLGCRRGGTRKCGTEGEREGRRKEEEEEEEMERERKSLA